MCVFFIIIIQASPAQKETKNRSSSVAIDIYDLPGPSTSRNFGSVYLHPDHALYHHSSGPVAGCSRDSDPTEVSNATIPASFKTVS